MEYSTRINLPQYKRRRVWMAAWRVLVYLVINAAFYAAVAFSGYFRHAVTTIVAEAVFAVISFRLMRLAEFFERSWDGVIVSAWFERRKVCNSIFIVTNGNSEYVYTAYPVYNGS